MSEAMPFGVMPFLPTLNMVKPCWMVINPEDRPAMPLSPILLSDRSSSHTLLPGFFLKASPRAMNPSGPASNPDRTRRVIV